MTAPDHRRIRSNDLLHRRGHPHMTHWSVLSGRRARDSAVPLPYAVGSRARPARSGRSCLRKRRAASRPPVTPAHVGPKPTQQGRPRSIIPHTAACGGLYVWIAGVDHAEQQIYFRHASARALDLSGEFPACKLRVSWAPRRVGALRGHSADTCLQRLIEASHPWGAPSLPAMTRAVGVLLPQDPGE